MGEFPGGLVGSWAPCIKLKHLLGDRALALVAGGCHRASVLPSLMATGATAPHDARTPAPSTAVYLAPKSSWGGSWCRDKALLWLGKRRRAATCHPPLAGAFIPGGGDSVFWPIRAWKRCRALAFWVSAVANCARGARWRLQPGGVTCLGITKGMGRNGGWWPGARAELGGEWGTPQPGCCPGAGWIWGRTGQEVLCGGRGHPGSCTPLGERPATIPIPPGVQSPPKWGPFPSTSGSLEGQRPRERARNVPQLCNHTTLHLGGNFFTFWLNCGR